MNFNRKSILLVLFSSAILVFASCKDQAKIDADKKAAEDKIEMEKANAEAEAKMMEEEAMKKEMMATSIAALASGDEDLSTLVAAINAAGLDGMLSEPGEYTVFAPTNAAFEKLPKNLAVAELVKPENKELLTTVLQYHVVPGVVNSSTLVEAIKGANGSYKITTAGGGELTASMKGDKVMLKDAKGKSVNVISVDLKASNGIIHMIDGVLMPQS
ncbi:MAG: fasciclin domain-containing protein [Maribacter sp.]